MDGGKKSKLKVWWKIKYEKRSNKSKDMLKWIRSNFEGLSLKNRESHQKLFCYYEKKDWS